MKYHEQSWEFMILKNMSWCVMQIDDNSWYFMRIHQKPWLPSTPGDENASSVEGFMLGLGAQCKLANNLTAILQAQSSSPAGLQDCQWQQGHVDMTSHIALTAGSSSYPSQPGGPTRGPADYEGFASHCCEGFLSLLYPPAPCGPPGCVFKLCGMSCLHVIHVTGSPVVLLDCLIVLEVLQ